MDQLACSRLGTCEVCETGSSKYCCPGCGVKSCSLECVKSHKKASGCSGVRCKSNYVSIHSFDDNQLHSDYYFLEDVGRVVDVSRRDRKFVARNSFRKSRQMTWLCRSAGERETVVKFLPAGMTKHEQNTSRTSKHPKIRKAWLISWRVCLRFLLSDVVYQEKCVSEETVVRALLDKYIHPVTSDPIARHRLSTYVTHGGTDNVEVWLEGRVGVAIKKLDVDASLRTNFHGCTITEFPTLLVTVRGEDGGMVLEEKRRHQHSDSGRKESDEMAGRVSCGERDTEEEGEVKDDEGSGSHFVEVLENGNVDLVDGKGSAEDWRDADRTGGCGQVCAPLNLIADSYNQSDDSEQE